MTFVYCRKYGERVCIWSDFVVTDDNKGKTEVFPGMLKSIIINHTCTIAFSGNINHAVEAIQSTKNINKITDIRKILLDASAEVDFIFVYHESGAFVEKISNAQVYKIDSECWIGNPSASALFSNPDELEIDEIPDFIETHEININNSIRKFFFDKGFNQNDGFGYFYCQTICSPFGHCYENSAMVSHFDTIDLDTGITKQQEHNAKTGVTQLSINKNGGSRGSHIFGVYFEQIEFAVVYDIMIYNYNDNWGFKKFRGLKLSEFTSQLKLESKKYELDDNEVHYSVRSAYNLRKIAHTF
ncbi:hypothetical protein [Oceanicaulis sp.]|uniref:hypothetical protein n=1 Tax=Oceanicaulis sp. TaxID=1924941 RepID=UPI003F71CF06